MGLSKPIRKGISAFKRNDLQAFCFDVRYRSNNGKTARSEGIQNLFLGEWWHYRVGVENGKTFLTFSQLECGRSPRSHSDHPSCRDFGCVIHPTTWRLPVPISQMPRQITTTGL